MKSTPRGYCRGRGHCGPIVLLSVGALLLLLSPSSVGHASAFSGGARAATGGSSRPALLATQSRTRPSSFRLAAADETTASDDVNKSGGFGEKAPPSAPPAPSTTASSPSTAAAAAAATAESDLTSRLLAEAREIGECAALLFGHVTKPDGAASADGIVALCDDLDAVPSVRSPDRDELMTTTKIDLRSRAIRAARYEALNKLMRRDYDAYVATASFLSPSRIPRDELPNVQDVPYPDLPEATSAAAAAAAGESEEGQPLVADCALDSKSFDDSPLDKLLLGIFRDLVTKNTGGVSSPKAGIEGLLEQGRTYMTQPGQTAEAQHAMVKNTLGGLMTPVLPPFYRIFMGGIVPQLGTDLDGKQFGPWFYAPWLTSVVTPTFFGFLVGPSRPNTRKDGQWGGLVVEKCKFLQESGCKGLCLHQCKLPAQEFFKEELGLDLTVSPNFVTQECQWSFGEVPLSPEEDPSFPTGCLVGCESRKAMASAYASGSGERPAVSCL